MSIIKKIYMDNNATTPLDPIVLETMLPFFTEYFGNASSIHFLGKEATYALEKARKQIANLIHARPNEIFFTSGATESNNWIIKGISEANKNHGNHIITTAVEHHSVLDVCKFLSTQGFEITYLPVDKYGRVSMQSIKNAIKDETILISIMFANNEVGAINDIQEIGELISEVNSSRDSYNLHKIYFHSDAVQAFGKLNIKVDNLLVDALSFSSHKIYGPKGTGAAYIKKGTKINPLIHGGYQENFMRAGTENIPNIVGFGESCEILSKEIDSNNIKIKNLKMKLYNAIITNIEDVYINGDLENSLSNTLNLSFKNIDGESLILLLSTKGIAVSNGSACTSGTDGTSHVLNAMGIDISFAKGAIRFSLGKFNTEEEIDELMNILPHIVQRLKDSSPIGKNKC